MNNSLPEKLREYLKTQNEKLADRANNFWEVVQPILDRQSKPNSNENGFAHVSMVEHNAWRFIRNSRKVDDFNDYELFILSIAACSHDFDKGLINKYLGTSEHGEGSGRFLIDKNEPLQLSFHEAVCVKQIIEIHDLSNGPFQEKLKERNRNYPLSSTSVNLHKLAVILKTADILHIDNSRIASIGIDISCMDPKEKNKHLARESISGWAIDGSNIFVNAVPPTREHLEALQGCIQYVKSEEWPAVEDKLSDYMFPSVIDFRIDHSYCGGTTETNKAEPIKNKFSQDNFVFNVPYREKGDGVVGREKALQQLRKQLTESRGTAIGQTAGFHGMGGLGKTQLAVEYAHRFKNEYPKGVIWINADQEIDPQLIQIAKKANWIAPESEHKLILDIAKRRLKIYSDCLIIFDNVEEREAIDPYLPEPEATPHLILTSRKPQPGFTPIDIDVLDEKEAADLLIKEAGREKNDLDSKEFEAIKNIVIELGGLPLALEIAGAYLKCYSSYSFEKYFSKLKENPTSALIGEKLVSFTRHESDLFKTLKISESEFEGLPLLQEILNVLAWSGSSFMGSSLLSSILDVDESSLQEPLCLGIELRILRKDETRDRFEIHRLIRNVRQAEYKLIDNREWAETICLRIGTWFETRREDFYNLAEYEAEFDHLKQWYQNAEGIQSNQNVRLLLLQAYPSYHWGNYNVTFQLVTSAFELYRKTASTNWELETKLLSEMGNVYALIGHFKESLKYYESTFRIRERQLGPEHHETASSLNNIGLAYGELGNYKKELEFCKRALKILERQLGPEHLETASSLNNVGSAYGNLGNHQKELEFCKRALIISEKQVGTDHLTTATYLNNVGVVYGDLHNHKQELEFSKRALRIVEKQLGPEHPRTAKTLNNVGSAYGNLGNHKKELMYKERALAISEKQLGSDHPEIATYLNNVGLAHGKLGNHQQELEFYKRSLEISEKQLGPEHPITAKSLYNVGFVYGDLGYHQKELMYKGRALRINEKQLGPEHPDTILILKNVVNDMIKFKRFHDAFVLLSKYLDILPKTNPKYEVLLSLEKRINSESQKSGFRAPSARRKKIKKRKGKRKRK